MPRFFLLVLVCLFGSGCAKLAHLQQLLTLKAYSEDKDRQQRVIDQANKDFSRLLETVRAGEIGRYEDGQQLVRDFGPPVFKRAWDRTGQGVEQWLYRQATDYFEGERVYFYFDRQGHIKDWEHIKLPSPAQGEIR